jgi:hypothetical protein
LPAVQQLYEAHGDAVGFLMVYIREAHPSDAWQISANLRDDVVHDDPADFDGRSELARTCTAALEITFPAVVDEMDDAVDAAYTGWPERIYVIGQDGRIRYKSAPGPFGFDPDDLARELERLRAEIVRGGARRSYAAERGGRTRPGAGATVRRLAPPQMGS